MALYRVDFRAYILDSFEVVYCYYLEYFHLMMKMMKVDAPTDLLYLEHHHLDYQHRVVAAIFQMGNSVSADWYCMVVVVVERNLPLFVEKMHHYFQLLKAGDRDGWEVAGCCSFLITT